MFSMEYDDEQAYRLLDDVLRCDALYLFARCGGGKKTNIM